MKIWKFFIAMALAIAVGVGIGYYAFDVSYENTGRAEYEKLQANMAKTPAPTQSPSVTVSPAPDKEASAVGEVYITPDVPTANKEMYMLKEYLGRIAVYKTYKSGQTTLMNIVDVSTDALPERDQNLLTNGIEGLSHEEMLQLLEDYTS